ncbi:alpha/beta hydrolase [Sphaerospermopsis sp. LEGE 08334]|jgi:predicted dienelactone hydrolase|uniref:alpha/beta hydrolase n=1 Tax=Sphaerospermopsis sp. LEGE 08334 TaxID=1828651 RepID=UPI00187F2886|nr:alpha/beta hydrolase [Sphaerospermopsis sp. LEGE 08334]MBE9057811.1 alpha/beta hydrolase [Sphaerospermopsis sp. LEGE 08334]
MNSLFGNFFSSLKKKSLLLVLSILLPTFGISNSVMAAEKIYVSYSVLEITIPVMSLETYTKTGIIDDKIAVYQQYISSDKLQELRQILLRNVKITPAVASQFLHTQQGEFIVQRLAKLITSKSPENESEIEDLRTAIISASGQPEGLTLLNLLRNYPSSSIRLNLADSLEIAAEIENIINETQQAIAILQQQSKIEAATIPKKNLSFLANLQNPGIFTFKKSTLEFFDLTRERHLLTDIYIPNLQNTTPVIVISHGLGLDSSNFRYLAKHLASHGFAVVVPNHPHLFFNNRNKRKLQEANEFINRPLDIKYILDQLEKTNQSDGEFKGKLNLQQVGIFGQSFGGYTALALAGAKINFQQLQQDCQPDALQDTWNMSLLLQCRALELQNKSTQQENINLRDQRIKAAIAVNPITSSIFGESGLNQMQTPVMFIGSSEDTVAPALYEQILPFSWLTNPHKYLVMLVGATHFSSIGNSNPGSQQIALPPDMVGNASQARTYINSLSLPFFQTFVYQKPQYLPYLNAGYAQTISSQSLGLNLVKYLKSPQLAPILEHNNQPAIPKKKLSLTIVRWGFWILNIGVSLLHLLIF